MIAFRQLALQRGGEPLIDHADLILHDGQKVGLVGANGAGKSSLFKLILGELGADRGEVEVTNGSRIAHMAQEIDALDRSLVEYVLDGDAALRETERLLEAARAGGDDLRQAELLGQYELHDGYSARARAEQLLVGLGFSQALLNDSLSAFSGGWRMRANLARTLFTPSDLLLLDEPTNHLDLDALLWLEQWLLRYPGTLLLISHDRDFLDAVCDRIIHFDARRLELYRGNYSAFERLRAERLASREAERAQQAARRVELEDFVRRFRAKASKARQAQSRLKMLERMEEVAPLRAASPFSFRLHGGDKASFPLLALDRASIGYADRGLLDDVRLTLAPGDRIGLLGPNGAGKSTLIKALTGELGLLAGERTEGEHLALGYFAQHQVDALDMESTPHQHVLKLSPAASDQEIRDFLGGFDFRGEAAFGRVGQFSGGEKARLALALIAWRRPNLLLLDEPTNHLDLEMRAALTEALAGFEGAVVIVSHDRHLLRASVDQFWCVADGRVAPFDGDLDDYHAWLRQRLGEQESHTASAEDAAPRVDRREQRRAAADRRERLKPLTRTRDAAERRIGELQAEIDTLEAELGDETLYLPARKQELVTRSRRRGELAVALEAAELAWLEAEEALERAGVE